MTTQRSFSSRPDQGRPRPQGATPARPVPPGGRIEQVRQVLDEVVTWQFAADSVVSHWLRAHPNMGMRDRGEVAEAVYDVLRHLRRYRQFAESGVGPATRRLAILGLWSTLGRERIAAGLDAGEQAWIDRVLQIDPAALSLPVRASIPDWLFERVKDLPDVESLLASLNQPASLDIRVNPMKADRDEMLADLTRGNGVRWSPVATPFSPWGIRLRGRPAMNKWHQFEHGLIEVQDEGSQLLALLVAPRRGEMVIDFCAGAGGKTLLLGALMRSTGRLYAFDVSAARLARAKPRFARSGLSNISPVAIEHENDARVRRLAGKAQRVLVDAPCSGIGTLRRNPDLKWRQNQQSLAELTALQARILASASRCVAPGGRLVYATCSILREENEAQVERFLAAHPDFELVDAAPILAARTPLQIEGPYLKLRPDVHGTDGFFAAVFDRSRKVVAKPGPVGADTLTSASADSVDEPLADTPGAADFGDESRADMPASTDSMDETQVNVASQALHEDEVAGAGAVAEVPDSPDQADAAATPNLDESVDRAVSARSARAGKAVKGWKDAVSAREPRTPKEPKVAKEPEAALEPKAAKNPKPMRGPRIVKRKLKAVKEPEGSAQSAAATEPGDTKPPKIS